jgi:hypothetical protein
LLSQNRSAIPTIKHGIMIVIATALLITPSNRNTTVTSIAPVAKYLGALNLGIRSSLARHFGHAISAAIFFKSANDGFASLFSRGSIRACNGSTTN